MIRADGISLFRQEESRKLSVECRRDCTLSSKLLNHTPRDYRILLEWSGDIRPDSSALSSPPTFINQRLNTATVKEYSMMECDKVGDRA